MNRLALVLLAGLAGAGGCQVERFRCQPLGQALADLAQAEKFGQTSEFA